MHIWIKLIRSITKDVVRLQVITMKYINEFIETITVDVYYDKWCIFVHIDNAIIHRNSITAETVQFLL